ncbi:hypothetical protein HGRIS_014785 [Hohenbuehelia grisea]|uniref:Uncharacterized protein n=1 Tax=Hohenbuehelia grisea TaxID=104357 RepID=A0ABR3IQN5_9AGAR
MSSKVVHFSLPETTSPKDTAQKAWRSPPLKPRTQPPTPVSVYGLYLTEDCISRIGRTVLPSNFTEKLALKCPDYAFYHVGLSYSNAHCQDTFPDIPLYWRSTVIVHTATRARPVVVLGHRTTAKDRKIYVSDDQMKRVREYLDLGDQEPAWYDVMSVS